MTPEGLVYRPELLTEAEERALLAELERIEYHEIRMHGVVAKRTARHFGVDYDYERRAAVREAEPLPDWLVPVRERAAELAGVEPAELAEILVQRYPPGAQIGWHRDAPAFGIVVGISLGSLRGCASAARRAACATPSSSSWSRDRAISWPARRARPGSTRCRRRRRSATRSRSGRCAAPATPSTPADDRFRVKA